MNNKENYKKAFDNIHAPERLKRETLEKAINAKKISKIKYMKVLSCVAVVAIICTVGLMNRKVTLDPGVQIAVSETGIKYSETDLPKFKNIQELRSALNESENIYFNSGLNGGLVFDAMASDSVMQSAGSELKDAVASQNKQEVAVGDLSGNRDFSTTNNQVANVDEADIVKTDGDYIYYVANNKVYIAGANKLDLLSTIDITENREERFYPTEIFINKDKLVVLGTHYIYEYEENILKEEYYDYGYYSSSKSRTKVMVYNMDDKKDLKLEREVALDGNYVQARMIDDNVYFISRKSIRYYRTMKDVELLPVVWDSVVGTKDIVIDCNRIIYFPENKTNTYMMVGGFNINSNEEMCVETFYGAGNEVYASENNLYITKQIYDNDLTDRKTTIYKFNLDNGTLKLDTTGEVKGFLNNQFSMDEYEGNLRLATTVYIDEEVRKELKDTRTGAISVVIDNQRITANNLYVLNEKLEVIGKIEDLAKDEKIYSARFVGDKGYVVTFKQIDPLFVIDLSNPNNPEVKGALKIPGYSSYLHPYDDNHIIGIGYNTKTNKYGNTTNTNMKMAMFDVSDLENPKEIFSVDIGDEKGYVSSDISYNHKALFYNKTKNLIGFPLRESSQSGIVIYKINLENGSFDDYGKIMYTNRYSDEIQRMIYIKDVLYTLSRDEIESFDLITFEKLNELELD